MVASSLIFVSVGLFLLLLGIGLLFSGVLLFGKHMKVAGTVVSLLGFGLIATPFLALLYFVIAIRVMG